MPCVCNCPKWSCLEMCAQHFLDFSWVSREINVRMKILSEKGRTRFHQTFHLYTFIGGISNQIWKAWFKDDEKERLQRDCIAFGRMKLLKFGRQCFYLSACNKDNFTRFPFIKCCSGAAQTGAFSCVHTHMHGHAHLHTVIAEKKQYLNLRSQ